MFEPVYTDSDFYDHVRQGIADYQGKPHLFQSEWRDFQIGPDGEYLDDDTFLLMPIEQSVFQLALEDWEIWCRWENAFKLGTAPPESHPVLPEDRDRHREIQRLLKGCLEIDLAKSVRKSAEFQRRNDYAEFRKPNDHPLEVRWFDLE